MICYYLFINHGWEPSKYLDLSMREKYVIGAFIEKEIKERKAAMSNNK
nr:MAG TPA: hypothetical protein [Caudoviricetes sp.]